MIDGERLSAVFAALNLVIKISDDGLPNGELDPFKAVARIYNAQPIPWDDDEIAAIRKLEKFDQEQSDDER